MLAIVCTAFLAGGAIFAHIQWLYWFLIAQLVWHALATRKLVFGTVLFFQIWAGLLAATASGMGPLWDRVASDISASVTPTLWLLLTIQLIVVALERFPLRGEGEHALGRPKFWEFLYPLVAPSFAIGSLLAFIFGLGGIADGIHNFELSRMQQYLLQYSQVSRSCS